MPHNITNVIPITMMLVAQAMTFQIRERYKRYTIMAEGRIFNLSNGNTVLTGSDSRGSTIKPYVARGPGVQPSAIEPSRMLRLNLPFKF